jgi:hypothetical protein
MALPSFSFFLKNKRERRLAGLFRTLSFSPRTVFFFCPQTGNSPKRYVAGNKFFSALPAKKLKTAVAFG